MSYRVPSPTGRSTRLLAVILIGLVLPAHGLAKRQATAKKILADAGLEGHEVTIYFPLQPRPYLPRPQDIADTVRQQLKAVGLVE